MRDNVAFLVEAAKERNKELNLRCCHANNCGYDSCGMIPLDKYVALPHCIIVTISVVYI